MKTIILCSLLMICGLSPQLTFGQDAHSKPPLLRIAPIQIVEAQPEGTIPIEVTLGVRGWISKLGGLSISPENITYVEHSWDGSRGGGLTIALDKSTSKAAMEFLGLLKESSCALELDGAFQASFLKISFREDRLILGFKSHDTFKRVVQTVEASGVESLSVVSSSIEQLTEKISKEPNSAPLYYKRAQAYRSAGQNNLAINDYSSAINLNPNLASAYLWRGRLFDIQKNFKRAIEDFTFAIQLEHSELALVHLLRGLAYLKNGQNKEGYADLNECVKLDPTMKSVIEATMDAARKKRD